MQHLDDRITELEQLVSGKHPDEDAFVASLKNKFATPEERAAQAEKAASLSASGPHGMVLSAEAAQLRTSLADALDRLAQMEERERQRNAAAELAAKDPKK